MPLLKQQHKFQYARRLVKVFGNSFILNKPSHKILDWWSVPVVSYSVLLVYLLTLAYDTHSLRICFPMFEFANVS